MFLESQVFDLVEVNRAPAKEARAIITAAKKEFIIVLFLFSPVYKNANDLQYVWIRLESQPTASEQLVSLHSGSRATIYSSLSTTFGYGVWQNGSDY